VIGLLTKGESLKKRNDLAVQFERRGCWGGEAFEKGKRISSRALKSKESSSVSRHGKSIMTRVKRSGGGGALKKRNRLRREGGGWSNQPTTWDEKR